ncbi:MAG: nuclease [Caldithrix sp.]|nr:nuclease [Caldithrix sp.]
MEDKRYFYAARVTRVYDGDTCTVDIDLGLYIWVRGETIRLARIDAPEIRGRERPQGLQSRDYLRSLIDNQEVFIQTIKDKKGKYGRYIGEIWVEHSAGNWINVSDNMVNEGYAIYFTY